MMTPDPKLLTRRSRGWPCGPPKNFSKNGSFRNGLCRCSVTRLSVQIFTTAGRTRSSMGARLGKVSPSTATGKDACALHGIDDITKARAHRSGFFGICSLGKHHRMGQKRRDGMSSASANYIHGGEDFFRPRRWSPHAAHVPLPHIDWPTRSARFGRQRRYRRRTF